MPKLNCEIHSKTIEIVDGNIDLVLYYNDDAGSFYFYRFKPIEIIGIKLRRNINIVNETQVKSFLKKHGKTYSETLEELLDKAIRDKMKERYDV